MTLYWKTLDMSEKYVFKVNYDELMFRKNGNYIYTNQYKRRMLR